MRSFWLNLPVKDVDKCKAFYTAIGLRPDPGYPKDGPGASFLAGEKDVVLMLFPEKMFAGFTGNKMSDTKAGSEVLLNLDAENRKEVDDMAETVRKAGGTIFSEPAEAQGWMYGLGFADPDGHRWNMLFMDMEKMPK